MASFRISAADTLAHAEDKVGSASAREDADAVIIINPAGSPFTRAGQQAA